MKKEKFFLFIGIGVIFYSITLSNVCSAADKTRIMVVDSYHKEYLWSQQTNEGFVASLLKFGYLDEAKNSKDFFENDYIETSKAVVKRLWMDTKRKKEKKDIAAVTSKQTAIIKEFNPNIIFLGDDNAANYIGNQFLDTKTPIVVWGVNNTPVKYGIINNEKKPGHNVTGVYQKTYYKESLALLKTIVPSANSFAILSDNTTTGRIHNKAIQYLARKGELPLKLVDTVATNDFEIWKKRTVELQAKVDAFFIASSSGLKDSTGVSITNEDAAKWYISNIKTPAAAGFRYRVEHGWLCAADDSGFNQGYEAGLIGHDILVNKADPAVYPTRVPPRGPLLVNKKRAAMLGITLTDEMGIEEYIEVTAPKTN